MEVSMTDEKGPLTHSLRPQLAELGFGIPQVETQPQKSPAKGDKRDGRKRRRFRQNFGGNMGTPATEQTNLAPAGGEKTTNRTMAAVSSAAKVTGVVLRDDAGRPFLRGLSYGAGACAGIMGALWVGTKVGLKTPLLG